MTKENKSQDHVIEYTVDDEPQTTTEKTMTPAQVLQNAGIGEADHYLVQIQGNHQVSYQDKPNEVLHMHPKMKFVSVSRVPTPVS